MPYSSISELPPTFGNLPSEAKTIALRVINGLLKKGISEESAIKQAWGAIKNAGWQKSGEEWVKATENFALETKSIKDVEIFAPGKWNGKVYTEKDMYELVNNYNLLKDTVKPYLKLGHDEGQGLLQSDGYPAAGWITNLKLKGGKLLADIAGIPQKIYELIEAGGYKRISSELYPNFRDHLDNVYGKVLRAVSLLGADTPAVGILNDIVMQYDEGQEYEKINYKEEKTMMTMDNLPEKVKGMPADHQNAFIKEYNSMLDAGKTPAECMAGAMKMMDDMMKAAEEQKAVELKKQEEIKMAEEKAMIEKLTAEKTEAEKKTEELQKQVEEFKVKEAEAKKKTKEMDITAFAESLLKEQKITPKQSTYMKLILNGLNESEVVTFKEGDKEEKMGIIEAFKKLMASNTKGNLLDMLSEHGENFTALEQAIEAEMKANDKLTYSQATKVASKKFPQLVEVVKSNE